MRKLLFVVAAAGLLLVAFAPVAVGDDDNEFRASLNGYLEVPSIATAARGSFRAELNGATLSYRLRSATSRRTRCSPTSTSPALT